MTALGRRDRKKQQTRAAIEHAALTLVAEAGLAGVTIESIADRADVTTRTFFNHFADKEDAVLGIPRGSMEDALTAPATTLSDTAQPLEVGLAVLRAQLQTIGDGQPGLDRERRVVLARHPELLVRQIERYVVVENQLTGLLDGAFAHIGLAEPERGRRARATTFLLTAAARLAVEEWCREAVPADDLPQQLDTALDLLAEILTERPAHG